MAGGRGVHRGMARARGHALTRACLLASNRPASFWPEGLIGRQVIAVVNIGTRRIAGFTSEVLVLGAMPTETEVVLLAVDRPVANGTRIG